jgi:hypothetical protein
VQAVEVEGMGGDRLTYDECANVVQAFDDAVLLAESVKGNPDLAGRTRTLRDCLGEFITSLLYESPIGDGRASHDDA